MIKTSSCRGCVFFVVFFFVAWSLGPQGYGAEQITITTYYPAPFGIYKEIRVDQMTVGSGYRTVSGLSDGSLNVQDHVGIAIPPGIAASYGLPAHLARLDINGYAAVNDVWLKDSGRWASQGKRIASGTGAAMMLPQTLTNYTVVCWATYFTCEDTAQQLSLDGAVVASYAGAGWDTEGCDQNTVMGVLPGVSWGPHVWNLSFGLQKNFTWMVIET